eukprot:scaffold123019_cov96-Phaeocystis_antarctica.AAC.1
MPPPRVNSGAAGPAVAGQAMQTSTSRMKRERERLRKVSARRKEQRQDNPTEAQVQQDHEFMDWRESQPEQYGDEPPNDTFELFLIEQRRVKEKQRLRLVEEKRKAARQPLHLSLTPEAVAERLERAEKSKALEQLCKAKRT